MAFRVIQVPWLYTGFKGISRLCPCTARELCAKLIPRSVNFSVVVANDEACSLCCHFSVKGERQLHIRQYGAMSGNLKPN
jgi:hypothetical protein